jgi:Uma2 family endonuclease
MAAEYTPSGWLVDEYLALELHSPVKHEYVRGHVYAMAGGTQAHSQLGGVAVALLRRLTHGGPCRVFNSDIMVRINADIYFYPDASVSCDARDRDPAGHELAYALLVLEVASPSTATYDRTEKFDNFRLCESLREYILVDYRALAVEVRSRGDDGVWRTRAYGPGDSVELPALNAAVPTEAFYEDVELEA